MASGTEELNLCVNIYMWLVLTMLDSCLTLLGVLREATLGSQDQTCTNHLHGVGELCLEEGHTFDSQAKFTSSEPHETGPWWKEDFSIRRGKRNSMGYQKPHPQSCPPMCHVPH